MSNTFISEYYIVMGDIEKGESAKRGNLFSRMLRCSTVTFGLETDKNNVYTCNNLFST